MGAYLPAVAENFGTRLILPDHSEVGNAVGAITGSILESVEVLIKPKPGVSAMENPPCTLHSSVEKKDFASVTEASEYAIEWATGIARTRALEAGADEVEVVVDKDERIGHLGKTWGTGYCWNRGSWSRRLQTAAVLRGEEMSETVRTS